MIHDSVMVLLRLLVFSDFRILGLLGGIPIRHLNGTSY